MTSKDVVFTYPTLLIDIRAVFIAIAGPRSALKMLALRSQDCSQLGFRVRKWYGAVVLQPAVEDAIAKLSADQGTILRADPQT